MGAMLLRVGLGFLPVLVIAQPLPLQFQFQPEAFPVSVNGFPTFQPWAGGQDDITPKFADLHNAGILDLYCGQINGYITYYHNTGNATTPNFQYLTGYYDRHEPDPNMHVWEPWRHR